MIKLTLKLGGELIEVIVKENELLFYSINTQTFTTIQGLKFSRAGVIKEFQDLEDNQEWKKIALERLKEKMKSFNSEKEKINYVLDELTRFGYEAQYYQRAGGRPTKLRNGKIE